jgi:hypothetical protein
LALSLKFPFLLKLRPYFGCYLLEEGALSVIYLERAAFFADLCGAAVFSLATTEVTYYRSELKVLKAGSVAL